MKNIKYEKFNSGSAELCRVVSDEIIVGSEKDILDIMSGAQSESIIIGVHNFSPDFFRLPTGLLGAVLGKCSTYRVRLAVVGEMSAYMTDNFRAFVRETNRYGNYIFVGTEAEAVGMWHKN